SEPVTVLVANAPPGVTLSSLALRIRSTVTLSAATTIPDGRTADSVVFERSPQGAGVWTPIGTVTSAPFQLDFDTTDLPDMTYDIRGRLIDSTGGTATSNVVTTTIVNSAPTVTLSDPGTGLKGTVTLSASATSPGTGGRSIVSVEVQRSPSGAG